ncbi:ParB/RepB/Spo0J family partition protein [Alkanindiges illinoisensis]|uniref:Probable chromosome-partitioning protein ParB n=1 Tax=Alkanindiges illinoisensis TaxID=197183 RepID=A0A4Y7X8K9_9GAMM|nr:ParB/RepB/Spo0J family partition protein [Alkanindiges illinoisensis]TEU23037.1 ParB/RepB/Spo0J family partition protein [Alkanindiges illinoisensis]
MTKKRGLAQGRGLDALLGSIRQVTQDVENSTISSNSAEQGQLQHIEVGQLQRGIYQPRREIANEQLTELSDSIKKHGIMQPIVVRRLGEQAKVPFEIIAGERRWRAAKLAGLTHIPALVRDIPDELAIALALIENIQREDLNPMEQAVALQRFHDEFGMSHQEIADTVGKARTTVSNLLRLISLHDDVKTMLDHGDIDMGHARSLLSLKSKDQIVVARTIVEKVLSVRQTEQLIRDLLNPPATKPKVQASADIEQLTRRLSERFGAQVEIDHNNKGKGKMVIRYHTLDELEGILAVIDPQ